MTLPVRESTVRVPAGGVWVEGTLSVPESALGVVLFAHGSGSSRFSPRNNYVAEVLRESALATLLMDLLTAEEDRNYETRFQIDLLARRLESGATWLRQFAATQSLPLLLFGASTGAAAALRVAAEHGGEVAAVVSRGGRPDLAGRSTLKAVASPTLLIDGGLDGIVIELNRTAYDALDCEKHLHIVPGATHLFEEPGKLEAVAALARDWFLQHLARPIRA